EVQPTHPCVGVRSDAAHPCASKLKWPLSLRNPASLIKTISVLMRRGEQYIANAHTRFCGLDFERSMECVALKRIKTALKQTPLCEGSPKGQRAGVCFLGHFFCTSVQTGDIGNKRAGTWVTLRHLHLMTGSLINHALETCCHHEPAIRIYTTGA
ncbi:MAG TPA: hypothetical protein VFY78_05860, partial [Gammaproteobacteria bacterium]|nr:hypothetical protein [Gammaproteobacteria bacterium]